MLPLPAAGAGATGDTAMSSTQHQLIEQCATRLRGIVEALDNIHDNTPHRWSTDLDDVHSSAESLLALIKDQAPTQDAQGLAGTALRDSPASVEQAGVDERAVFEFFVRKHCGMPEHIAVNWDAKFTNDAWEGWKARAALAQPSPAPTTSGYDQLWGWFGLSRSAYAVLPRVMMHAMPDDWQARFAELMDEWDDHWPNQPDITAHVQIKQNNRFISTPPWLLNYRHPDHNQLNAMRGKGEL